MKVFQLRTKYLFTIHPQGTSKCDNNKNINVLFILTGNI